MDRASRSRSPLPSSNSSCPATVDDYNDTLRPLRACEYCRQHKVRCDIDQRDPVGSCGRCVKAGRDCVSGSYSRKRRKTTDSRVMELESRVERLTARLDEIERGRGMRVPVVAAAAAAVAAAATATATATATAAATAAAAAAAVAAVDPLETERDPIDRQLLSVEMAGRIFQHYVTEMSTILPAVVFAPGTASSDIRRHKPVLFLAILVAASGKFDDALRERLHGELMRVLSDQIICRGLKSLEIIQALVITVLWYQMAEYIGNGRLNQLVHMAAIMASDIAINKPNTNMRAPLDPGADARGEQQWNDQFPAGTGWRFIIGNVKCDPSLPESRRALLACYFMCSNIARRLRRVNLFPFTNYISECIQFFETSTEPGVFPSDKNFVQWIKISRMAEEFGAAFVPSDPGDPGTSDYRAQIILERFMERMTAWRRQAVADTMTPALDLFAQSTVKHLYDLILNSERTADEFRPLVFEAFVARAQRELSASPPTKFRADVVRACLASVHSCLDFFLMFSPDFVRSLPVLFFAEMGYTIGLLLKISFVAALSNRVLDRTQIRFGDYIDRVLNFLSIVTNQNEQHATERLRQIMVGLRNWVENHKQKIGELSALSVKAPLVVQAFSPAPAPVQYPTTDLAPPPPPPSGEPFVGYGDAGRETVQEMEGGDPMLWEGFPLTEFLQLDGVPDLYSPWG